MITTEYSVAGPAHITIAIVADLHEFEPKPVLSRLSEIRPDVIAVPGDLFENHEFGENLDKEDDSLISRVLCRIIHITNRLAGLRWRQKHRCSKKNAYDFLMKASEIAPVVMSLGNHELYLTEEDKEVLKDAKVALLNNSTVEIKNVLFGGIPSKQITEKIDTEFLRRFSDLPGYKVLLCHHPEYYCQLRSYPINLFLSGHCHGGQIRICNHGIFAPGQGLLPRYHHGVYDGRLVVSSGCANTASIRRTAKGLRFHYSIKGNEIFFSRKEKSVTRATANIALGNAVKLQKEGFVITGPKMLRCFGASYLYPVFIRIGVIQNGDKRI